MTIKKKNLIIICLVLSHNLLNAQCMQLISSEQYAKENPKLKCIEVKLMPPSVKAQKIWYGKACTSKEDSLVITFEETADTLCTLVDEDFSYKLYNVETGELLAQNYVNGKWYSGTIRYYPDELMRKYRLVIMMLDREKKKKLKTLYFRLGYGTK